eukprot:6479562-Amphidinium_carterae.1
MSLRLTKALAQQHPTRFAKAHRSRAHQPLHQQKPLRAHPPPPPPESPIQHVQCCLGLHVIVDSLMEPFL